MSLRVIASLRVVAVVAVVSVGAVSAVAQTDPPRTAWGQPDLQGVWDFRTITPMQRPERLADQEFLTEEEAADLDQAAFDRNTRLYDREAQRTAAGGNVDSRGRGEAPGSYNQFWIDSGTRTIGTRRTSLIIDPPNGRYPSQTDAARERAQARRAYVREHPADGPEDFSAGVRCILGFNAGPPFLPSAYNNNMQLFQTPDHVVIHDRDGQHVAGYSARRASPTRFEHPAVVGRFAWPLGRARRWSSRRATSTLSGGGGTRTESMRLVERLTRVDAETLVYEVTVTDPETWTSPWTASVPLRLNPELIFEYACHEGNYSMPVMLGGTRAEEKAAAGQP